MKKLTVKIIIDVILAVLSVLLMLFGLTGVFVHEVLAVGFTIMIAIHLVLNRNWFKAKKMPDGTRVRKVTTKKVWTIILIVSTLIVLVSGFAVSQVIFPLGTAPQLFAIIHNISPKLFFISCIAHVVLHRQYLQAAFKKLTSRKINADVSAS